MDDLSILNRLAFSLNRRDEVPNQELAKEIAANKDKAAVKVLIDNLNHKSKAIQSDCIKVLYEVGESAPSLIAQYSDEFLALLSRKNNRLQWGAMTALSSITAENPAVIYASLTRIIEAADKGSVITKDHAVNILTRLYGVEEYADNAFALLNEQLLKSPVNQLPMYAEKSLPFIREDHKAMFIKTLSGRLPEIEKESKKKRVEKVIKKARQ